METDRSIAEREVSARRTEIIDRLAGFAVHDVLLFRSDDHAVHARQEQQWQPVLDRINKRYALDFQPTDGLETPLCNEKQAALLKTVLEGLPLKELTAVYDASMHMRSVLLALALVRGDISAGEAFELSELEELYQMQKWGADEEAENRRRLLQKSLSDIEKYVRP